MLCGSQSEIKKILRMNKKTFSEKSIHNVTDSDNLSNHKGSSKKKLNLLMTLIFVDFF